MQGYCYSQCRGGVLEPGSKYNLAGTKFDHLWNSDFYDLRSYESGLCHTYNPPDRSAYGTTNMLYFLLGQIQDKANNYMLFNFYTRMVSFGQEMT